MAQTSTTENLTTETSETIAKKLFDSVMQQKWKEVAKIYKEHPSSHTIKITSTGETALHLAISDPEYKNKVKKVKELVRHIKDPLEVLNLETEKGNTPLHSAAATGQSGKVCELLIKSVGGVKSKNALELVGVRCKKGETPLFKAVHYGRLGSFFYLHSIIWEHFGEKFSNFERNDGQSILDDPIIRPILVRQDGQSILHDAIIREHFDFAFHIIHLYKGLVNLVDHQGDSPLHALARKAAAFKSGSSLHGWDKLIYKCISVEKLKPLEYCTKRDGEIHQISEPRTRTGYVEKERTNIDIESGEGSNIPPEIEQLLKQSHNTSRSWNFYVIFGYGPKTVYKIYKEKLKRTWAKQVLDGLLDRATMYDNMQYCVRKPGQQPKIEKKLHNDPFFNIHMQNLLFNKYFRPNGNGKKETAQPQEEEEEEEEEKGSDQLDSTEDSEEEFGEYISENSGVELSSSISKSSREELSSASGTNAGGKDVSQSCREELSSSSVTNAVAGKDESSKIKRKDTALLIAAKYGIFEMVKRIIDKFPVAIYDEDIDGNNVLLVAVEKRHLQLYKHLIDRYPQKSVVHQREDRDGNTALHLAATYDKEQLRPWPVPGAALQMQWEIKWYEFVEYTMPSRLFLRTNKKDQTPRDIFSTTHKDLIKDGVQWLQGTATSCSVVAALIVTIAFASSTTVPGGTDTNTGKPTLRNNSTFDIFAIASLIALCFSVTALITFLSILTSRHHEKDFGKNLPRKILMGLTSLFVSISAMLVTFCAGHFLVFEEKIKYAAFLIYTVMLFPLCLFAVAQFPLYFDLVRATFFSPFRYDFSSFLKKLKKTVKEVSKPETPEPRGS